VIKAIVCDFGGVIGTDVDLIVEDVFEDNGLLRDLAISIWSKHWPFLKVGTESIEKYWSEISEKLEDELLANKIRNEVTERMEVYAPVVEYLSSFRKKGFIVVILSNESEEWMNIYRKKGGLDKAFDKLYVSGELGMAKPQSEFFEIVLKEQKLLPEETIFIDNMKRNTDAAESLGIKSIFYSDLENLKKELANIVSPLDQL